MQDEIERSATDQWRALCVELLAIVKAQGGDMLDTLSEASQRALAALSSRTPDSVRAEALEDALEAQPSTAEDPNESAYQRGRFDGIMEYAAAIRALADPGGAEVASPMQPEV